MSLIENLCSVARWEHIKGSLFLQNIAVLSSGTALAQLIQIFASPILTRLYTPADFGLFAIFMAIVSSLSPAVCGKYEVAMVLPKSNAQGKHLFGIAVIFALVISILFLIIIFNLRDTILSLLNVINIGNWILFVPIFLFMLGIFIASGYYANRCKSYSLLAQSKITQAIVVVFVNVILGLFKVGFVGLLLGNLLGLLTASIFLLYRQYPDITWEILSWTPRKWILLKRYGDYPLYNASSGLLDGITTSIPVFFLGYYFSDSVVGYFALVTRVAYAPMSFLSMAVSQVNLKKIVELINMAQPVTPYLQRITIGLFLVVLMPTMVFIVWGAPLFEWVFGSQWYVAGEYIQIIMPAVAVRFVVSTMSSTLGATKNNHYGAIWKSTAFISTLIVFAVFAPQGNIMRLLTASVINDILLYSFYYLLIWKSACNPRNFSYVRHSRNL